MAEEIRRRVPGPDSPAWQSLDLDIGGRPHRFRSLEQDEYWAAGGRVGEVLLLVSGYRFPAAGVRLTRVSEPQLYLGATR
jgi:hypothetical protein